MGSSRGEIETDHGLRCQAPKAMQARGKASQPHSRNGRGGHVHYPIKVGAFEGGAQLHLVQAKPLVMGKP